MFFQLKRDRYCSLCLTANLNQRYKCLRCRRSECFECTQESFEGSEHSRTHPMQLLTNRRRSDFFIGGETFLYMMATKFTCPICSLIDYDECGLVKHIEQEHNGNNELVFCPICIAMPNSSNASRVWNLWDHMRLHHLSSGNRDPLLSPLSISEVDESEEEPYYVGPNNSPAEDIDNLMFFNDLPTNIVASDPASIGAMNIFDQMETDLSDYVEPINVDALLNENSAAGINSSSTEVSNNHVSLNEFEISSNAAQLANDILNDGVMAGEILTSGISDGATSSTGIISGLLVDPYDVNQEAFLASNRFSRRGIPTNDSQAIETASNRVAVDNYLSNRLADEYFPLANGLRTDGTWERRRNGYATNAVAPRTMMSAGQIIRSNAEADNAFDFGNVDNETFVLPRLWPQYAQEEVTMARAIARTTEEMSPLTEDGPSNEPSESNDNNL